MEQLVDDGLVRHLGVSNFSVKQVEKLLETARIKPVANQVELHPFLAQRKLVGVCARKVPLQPMSHRHIPALRLHRRSKHCSTQPLQQLDEAVSFLQAAQIGVCAGEVI